MERTASTIQMRQTKQRFATQEDYLSYELGQSVKALPPLYTRLLASGISLLLFGSLIWAHFSKIDEVVVANGKLTPAHQMRPIRSLQPGTIRAVNVTTGEKVEQGDILVEHDPAMSQAEIERLENSAQLIRQEISRLDAERSGAENTGALLQDQLLTARLQDFESRRAGAIADANRQLAIIDEARVKLDRLKTNLFQAHKILNTARERHQSMAQLEAPGAISQFEYLDVQDRLTDAQDRVFSLEADIAAQHQVIRQAEEAYQTAQNVSERLASERQSQILAQLQQRREDLTALEGQLTQARKQQELETIEAPIDGVVYDVKASPGPVQAGEELLSILPAEETIILSAQVQNLDIGFIREGMAVKVKVATFPFQEFGTLQGTVTQISPNSIGEKDVGLVFPVEIAIAQRHIEIDGQTTQLLPGMTASGDIVTRKKSVLQAVLEPVTRRFSEALRER